MTYRGFENPETDGVYHWLREKPRLARLQAVMDQVFCQFDLDDGEDVRAAIVHGAMALKAFAASNLGASFPAPLQGYNAVVIALVDLVLDKVNWEEVADVWMIDYKFNQRGDLDEH